jgi:hypothetical protein
LNTYGDDTCQLEQQGERINKFTIKKCNWHDQKIVLSDDDDASVFKETNFQITKPGKFEMTSSDDVAPAPKNLDKNKQPFKQTIIERSSDDDKIPSKPKQQIKLETIKQTKFQISSSVDDKISFQPKQQIKSEPVKSTKNQKISNHDDIPLQQKQLKTNPPLFKLTIFKYLLLLMTFQIPNKTTNI